MEALALILFVSGIVGLWASSKFTVVRAKKLINSIGIPSFIFGAVFIAISTGLPEIATAIVSSYEGVPMVSAGDLTGSSLINLSLILGITTVYAGGMKIKGSDLKIIRTAGIGTALAAMTLMVFPQLSYISVSVLLLIYLGFLVTAEESEYQNQESGETSPKTVLAALSGIAALLISARMVVFGVEQIGKSLGVPVEILGATVVAVGTGLPELAFEITSIKKGDTSLALGDLFGSSIVNITLSMSVLGILATPNVSSLLPVLAGVTLVSATSIIFSYKGEFSTKEGIFMISVSILFFITQIIR